MPVETLVSKQNRDGGWPYVHGSSWTEPTVYAILALSAAGERESARRGIDWIRAAQRSDGGWAPQRAVDQSTWVTALALLLPEEALDGRARDRALEWLKGAVGEEFTLAHRVRAWLFGQREATSGQPPGWPWVPGNAAWVGPTAIAILALDREMRRKGSAAVRARIESGRQFLLDRMCQEGGWNHGSTRVLGYEAPPYPETTGMALAALRGVQSPKVERSLDVARLFLKECRSADARNWLRLGLLAHGQTPAADETNNLPCRTLPETSLAMLIGGSQPGQFLLWG